MATPDVFNLPHSALIRIWHWLLFVLIAFSLFTVLAGNTLLKPKNTTAMVQHSLKENGIVVNEDQAHGVAHEFHDLIWTWHKIIGYGLGMLLILRFFIEFAQSNKERMAMRIKNAKEAIVSEKTKPIPIQNTLIADLKHFIVVNRAYLLFFLLLAFMAVTGLGMAYEDDIPWLDHIHKLNHTLHGYGQYLMYTYLILHIGGVVIADMTKHKGIVSGMIHGNQ